MGGPNPGSLFEFSTGEGRLSSCLDLEDSEHLEFNMPDAWAERGTFDVGLGLTLYRDGLPPLDAVPFHANVVAREATAPLGGGARDLARSKVTDGWELDAATLAATPSLLPSLSAPVLVVCHYDEDLAWVRYQPFPAVVYEKRRDNVHAAGLHGVPRNTANEASAFLKFIVDYYDALPSTMIFLHGHRYAYHQEDVLSILNDLDVDPDVEYCNLNLAVWGTHEDPSRALLYETHRRWLEDHLGPLPPLLFDRCCAQFLVKRDNVRTRPKAFYEAALQHAYFDVEPLPHGDWEQNRQIGLLFEWLWHYLFGQPPVNPELDDLVPDIEHTDLVYLAGNRKRPTCAQRPRSESRK